MPDYSADLSIYGPPKPAIPYVPSDVRAAQDEAAQAKADQARKLREAALDDARERAAMQASLDPKTGAPDPDLYAGAAVKFGVTPARMQATQAKFDTHFKAQQETQKYRDEHAKADQEFRANFIGGIDNQTKLDVARDLHPDWNLPQDFETGKDAIRLIADSASTEAQKAEMRSKALTDAQKATEFAAGTPERMAKGLAAAATFVANDGPEGYQQAKQGGLKALGFDQAIIDALPAQYDAQALANIAMGPKEVATLAGQADARRVSAENTAADNKRADAALGISRAHLALAQQDAAQKKQGAAAAEAALKPGTRQYREAQDLSDGTLTYADFLRLHGRAQAGAAEREAIYDTARQLNPSFNPAAFEIGYKFSSNPKVRQQISSIKNVEAGVPDLLKFSDAASRSGSPTLNAYLVQPFKMSVGNKQYSNFKTAATAFADELSGALGYGSATDMSREMGFSMTDMAQSPANFASNMRDVVLPFVARKKASIVGEMGPYGGGSNPTTGAGAPKPGAAKKDPLGIR